MSYSQKSGTRIRNGMESFISMDDVWKARVILDAIKSKRKVKARLFKFF